MSARSSGRGTSWEETLGFLMTREISHFQMSEAALEAIKPNFPPGVLQGDPRYGISSST